MMSFNQSARLAASAVLIAALVACKSVPEPVAPVAAAPPAPPPPPAPGIMISNNIVELASTYRTVMTAASGIAPTFTSGEDVAQALKISSAYEQTQLQQGAVAFIAVAALQEPNFVASVRAFVNDPAQRQQVTYHLMSNPNYVTTFPNVDKAAGLAISAVDGLGARVTVAGRAVKQAAYDTQRQSWSKVSVANPAGRLADTKIRSKERRAALLEDVMELRRASVGEAAMSLSGAPVQGPYSQAVTRGLAVAALAALGQAGDENAAQIEPLLTEQQSGYCLSMAKLNLYQCLAVSKPHYEDIFCLGQHAMIDTGQCMIKAANSPTPAFVEPPAPPPPVKAAAPKAKPRAKARKG